MMMKNKKKMMMMMMTTVMQLSPLLPLRVKKTTCI